MHKKQDLSAVCGVCPHRQSANTGWKDVLCMWEFALRLCLSAMQVATLTIGGLD